MISSKQLIQAAAGAGGEPDFFILSFGTSGSITSLVGIDVDTNGDIVAGGFTTHASAQGNADVFLVKVDVSGDVIWEVMSGDTGATTGDYVNSVKIDSNDNIYAAGYFTHISGDSTAGLMQKYDSDGNLTWANAIDGPLYDTINGIDISSDDSKIYYAGAHDRTLSTPNGYNWGYVNSAGTSIVDYRYENASYSSNANDVAVAPNGNVFTVGSGYKGTTGSWPMVYRLTSSGAGSQRILTSTSTQVTYHISAAALSDSTAVVAGRANTGSARYSLLLQRLNSSLVPIWTRIIRRPMTGTSYYTQVPSKVVVDSNDNIYVASAARGNKHACIMKFDSNGTLDWANEITTSSEDITITFHKICLDANEEHLYLAGYEKATSTGGSTQSGFIVKIPTDGSALGTYGPFIYQATPSLTDLSASYSTQTPDGSYGSASQQLKTSAFTNVDPNMTTSIEKG
jgi:hypothetical protein